MSGVTEMLAYLKERLLFTEVTGSRLVHSPKAFVTGSEAFRFPTEPEPRDVSVGIKSSVNFLLCWFPELSAERALNWN